ncbi:MAG: ParB/RepB/Spo0J family partition protein [Henriciella sp.]
MDVFSRILGARPNLTFVICQHQITEIWVEGRAPTITIRDYDWGESDPDPCRDADGFPFTKINWRRPAWALGLSLHSPEQETLMAQPQLKSVPLDQLKISKLNMRHSRKTPDVSDILPSIRASGLRQTLLVRREGDHYGVVAGRRRYFALLALAEETGTVPLVQCTIMEAGDDAAAIEASIIENVARLPATEMEQFNAFRALAKKGRSIEQIAVNFGVTELSVRRVLALANLAAPIRKYYAAEEIDRATIQALTLATPKQQAEWLRLFKSDDERAPLGRTCKAWVTGGATITTDKALFDLAGYDGAVTADLFGEHGVFADVGAFWESQSKAVAGRVETYLEAGWSDVQVLERGTYFAPWDYVKRPRTKGGKVFVEVRHDGTVTFHEGYISQAESRKLERAKTGDAAETKAIRPEMSGPMAQYILLHRHGAARATLLQYPDIAHRLMVAHAIVGSALWSIQAHRCAARKEDTRASLATSLAEAEIEAARQTVETLFSALGVHTKHNGDTYHLCEVFSALLAMSDDEVAAVLAYTMAATLELGGAVVEAVAHVTETDMSAYWTPERAFFELLRDKRAINAMVADIGTQTLADSCVTDTAKVQKQVIANRIEGEGCEPCPDWRPRWMQVPPTRLVEGAGCAPADAWDRIKGLFEALEESFSDDGDEDMSNEIAA